MFPFPITSTDFHSYFCSSFGSTVQAICTAKSPTTNCTEHFQSIKSNPSRREYPFHLKSICVCGFHTSWVQNSNGGDDKRKMNCYNATLHFWHFASTDVRARRKNWKTLSGGTKDCVQNRIFFRTNEKHTRNRLKSVHGVRVFNLDKSTNSGHEIDLIVSSEKD